MDAAVAAAGRLGAPNLPADGDGVYVLLGVGGGTFGAATRLEAGEQPTAVLDADFNGDDIELRRGQKRGPSVS